MKTKIDTTDMVGRTFTRLTAIEEVPPELDATQRIGMWRFRCSCGTVKVINLRSVLVGLTKSCGCFRKEATGQRSKGGQVARRKLQEQIVFSRPITKNTLRIDPTIVVVETPRKIFSDFSYGCTSY